MEEYIIHINRRDPADPERLSGEIEGFRTKERKEFTNFGELAAVLNTFTRNTQYQYRVR